MRNLFWMFLRSVGWGFLVVAVTLAVLQFPSRPVQPKTEHVALLALLSIACSVAAIAWRSN